MLSDFRGVFLQELEEQLQVMDEEILKLASKTTVRESSPPE